MRRFFVIGMLLMLGCLAPRVFGAEFEYGERPKSSIYDPERKLSQELTQRLTTDLAKVRKNEQVDIMVVVVPDVGELPPQHVARRFAEAWGTALFHGVIIDVSNRDDGPWIYIGGEITYNDQKEILPRKIEQTLRLARQEPDRESRLLSATTQTSDHLRFLLGNVMSQKERYTVDAVRKRMEEEEKAHIKRLVLIIGGAAFLPGCALLYVLICVLLRCKRRRFPPIQWTRRLGAPYAGGNDATADFSRSRSSSPRP